MAEYVAQVCAGHKLNQLRKYVKAQAFIAMGDNIGSFHSMALPIKGRSILKCIQMESHGANINEKTSHDFCGKFFCDGYLPSPMGH
jgi:hypothetical protein